MPINLQALLNLYIFLRCECKTILPCYATILKTAMTGSQTENLLELFPTKLLTLY